MVSSLAPPTVPEPLVPDYAGACLSNVVPAVLEPPHTRPEWFPTAAWGADQVVLLTLDGLGWDQLQDRRALVPSTASLEGGPILTVAPSTTATALSSLCLGAPPGEHGVVGYRINVRGDVLNVLRWQTPHGDARTVIPPDAIQNRPAFCGKRPTVVTRAEFAGTGFTAAHLSNVRFRGYRVPSTMVTEVDHALRRGERFVYAYYDGIDKVAHEYGLGDFYDAELVAVDRIIADLVSVRPSCRSTTRSSTTSSCSPVKVGSDGCTPDPDKRMGCVTPPPPITAPVPGCVPVSRSSRTGGSDRR
jgi:hypothetical protein